MAPAGPCHTLLAATGFTNKNLRVLVAGLLGSTCAEDGLVPAQLCRTHPVILAVRQTRP
jgi:hypothetical protein